MCKLLFLILCLIGKTLSCIKTENCQLCTRNDCYFIETRQFTRCMLPPFPNGTYHTVPPGGNCPSTTTPTPTTSATSTTSVKPTTSSTPKPSNQDSDYNITLWFSVSINIIFFLGCIALVIKNRQRWFYCRIATQSQSDETRDTFDLSSYQEIPF
jgi:hypothetical protein